MLNGAPITMNLAQKKKTTLSVTESERSAGVTCAQDMLFIMRVVESMQLNVKKTIKIYVDNKGAVDLANNRSVG